MFQPLRAAWDDEFSAVVQTAGEQTARFRIRSAKLRWDATFPEQLQRG